MSITSNHYFYIKKVFHLKQELSINQQNESHLCEWQIFRSLTVKKKHISPTARFYTTQTDRQTDTWIDTHSDIKTYTYIDA